MFENVTAKWTFSDQQLFLFFLAKAAVIKTKSAIEPQKPVFWRLFTEVTGKSIG